MIEQMLSSLRGGAALAAALQRVMRRLSLRPLPVGAMPSLARGLAAAEAPHALALRFQTQRQPEAVALVYGERVIRYAELNARVHRLCRVLQARGLKPGGELAVMLPNRPELIEVALAAGRIGARLTPVGSSLKQDAVSYILRDSGAQLLVTHNAGLRSVDDALRSQLHTLLVGTEPIADGLGSSSRYETELAQVSPEAWFAPISERSPGRLVMYTSGTTGRPKGAERDLRRANLRSVVHTLDRFELGSDEVLYLCTPLYHSAPFAAAMIVLSIGGTLVLDSRWEGMGSLEAMTRHEVTSMLAVPTLIRRWLDLPAEARRAAHPPRLERVFSVGATFPAPWKLEASEAIGPIFYDFYGATELGIISISSPEQTASHPESVGQVVPGVEVRLLDEQGREVPPGERGVLYARGQNFEGYLGGRERDASDFISVGDVAVLDEEGFLHIVDRVVDRVVSGGVNVYPAEVEQALLKHPKVKDIGVIGVPHLEFGEALHAFVVREEEGDVDEAALLEYAEGVLAPCKRPRYVTFLEELPRSPQGKVLKRLLKQQVIGQIVRMTPTTME